MSWWLGLDLGQASDFSALARVEQVRGRCAVRHLERFPNGTPYTDVVARVRDVVAAPALAGCTLVPDATGVGRAVVDLLLQAGLAARVLPVTITAGKRVTSDGRGGANVPKKDLVAAVQAARRDPRLEVASSLPLAQVLVRELEAFTVKITDSGNETFGADKDRSHDDLVLAVSLALWAAENVKYENRSTL
ncbi:MAG TPA: hypothetical protein VFE62_17275 [Gemmataceae bacterium]|nr:hypothetical protein [Gemmataceae bacterium]